MNNCVSLHQSNASKTGIVNCCVTNTSKQPLVTHVTDENKHLTQRCTTKHMEINKSTHANEQIYSNNTLQKKEGQTTQVQVSHVIIQAKKYRQHIPLFNCTI